MPIIPKEHKNIVIKHGNNVYTVIGRYGYAENRVKIAEVMEMAFQNGLTKPLKYTVYFSVEYISIKRKNLIQRVVLNVYMTIKRFFIGR